MDNNYENLMKALGEKRVRVNEPMANHTTFKIGGPADLFIEVDSEEEIVRVLREVRDLGIPYLILGGGSNLLVGDKGVRGVVIKLRITNFEFRINGDNALLTVGAGVTVGNFLTKLLENSITGLEFMAGIPGTMGATVACNAGAWQKSLSEVVNRVKVLSPEGEIKWINKEECEFDYRHSRFKGGKDIILEVELELATGNPEEIKKQIGDNLEKRSCQPKEPSAGSIFINPKPLSAGKLIEECNFKGKKIGGAQISEKHANFIVNIGNAKATDVVSLIDFVKSEVKNKFNVELKEEIIRVGEF